MPLDQANYQAMLIDKRDNGVAVVTLNRPERLNAVNGQMHHEMASFTRDAQTDDDVKVVVLAGTGRAFCAGGDFSDTGGPAVSFEEGRQIVDHLLELRKPIISAVQGYAMGLGANIALLCDVVVAGHSSVFADTHVNMGIGAGDGGQVIWPLLMGVNRAKWHLMTGERVTGEMLLRHGPRQFPGGRRRNPRHGAGRKPGSSPQDRRRPSARRRCPSTTGSGRCRPRSCRCRSAWKARRSTAAMPARPSGPSWRSDRPSSTRG